MTYTVKEYERHPSKMMHKFYIASESKTLVGNSNKYRLMDSDKVDKNITLPATFTKHSALGIADCLNTLPNASPTLVIELYFLGK